MIVTLLVLILMVLILGAEATIGFIGWLLKWAVVLGFVGIIGIVLYAAVVSA